MEKNYRLLKNRANEPVLDYLLKNRQAIKPDIDKTFEDIDFNHPFANEKEVLDLLQNAIESKLDTIGFIVDVDSDGNNSLMILHEGFKPFFKNMVHVYCERANGYGIREQYYDELKARGVTLAITADIGITGRKAVEYGKSLGITTVITDHHTIQAEDLPDCLIINPKLSGVGDYFYDLCGAGIVYFVIGKLCRRLGMEFDSDRVLLHHATTGTIGK